MRCSDPTKPIRIVHPRGVGIQSTVHFSGACLKAIVGGRVAIHQHGQFRWVRVDATDCRQHVEKGIRIIAGTEQTAIDAGRDATSRASPPLHKQNGLYLGYFIAAKKKRLVAPFSSSLPYYYI